MLLVVGGQHRKIGKTCLVEELIRATPEARWTALKIAHRHAGLATHGDTERYLSAGAARSQLLEIEPGGLRLAVPAIREILATSPNVICESNSILEFFRPDLYLFISDPADPEMKDSARRFASRADLVLHPPAQLTPDLIALVRRFLAAPGRPL